MERMRSAWLALLCVAAGCYESGMLTCGDKLCPHEKVCSPITTCVDPAQLDACAGVVDGTSCMTAAIPTGTCAASICIAAGCGNGFVEAGEVCDDGNRISFDGCRADCASREMCGDGIVDPAFGEACDCGMPGTLSPTCLQPNSQLSGAECREDCKLARCGDSILDPDELCDDGNTQGFDGCRADCQGRFTKMQTPTARTLLAVWTTGKDAWAAGEVGTVLRYDGSAWTDISPNVTADVRLLWASSPNDVYIGGEALLRHYNGTSWTNVNPGFGFVNGIWGSAANDVYVVGTVTNTGLHVEHFDGATWTPISVCPAMTYATFLTGVSSTRIFITGPDGVCRFNGSNGTMIRTSATGEVAAVTGTEVYAKTSVGVGTWSGSGTTWTDDPIPGSTGTIDAIAAGSLLFAGDFGVVLGRKNNVWTHYVTPTEQQLIDIASTSESNVFIVGEAGTVLH
jgi:cysteine-rich repeat protein